MANGQYTTDYKGRVLALRKSDYKQNLRNTLSTTGYLLRYVFREKKAWGYAAIKFVMATYSVLPTLVYTVFPGLIITELTEARRLPTLFFYLAVLVLTPIFDRLLRRFVNIPQNKLRHALSNTFQRDYDRHAAMMDYDVFEDPDMLDIDDRVRYIATDAHEVIDRLCALYSAVLKLAAIFTIIYSLNAFIVVVVFIVIILNSRITKWNSKKDNETRKMLTPIERYTNTSSTAYALHEQSSAKEVRIFHLRDFFADLLYEKRAEWNRVALRYTRYSSNASILYALTDFLQQTLMYVYLILMVVFRGLAIGSMTIYMSAVSQFSGSFQGIVNSYLDMAREGLLIDEFRTFMQTPPRQYSTGDKTPPPFDENSVIEFRDVSFQYKGATAWALRHVNLTLHGGERLCIVGQNGSGKTTFVKLLMRLYFPTEGEILLNGVNINEFDYEKYTSMFAPVFQDYSLYSMPLRENITFTHKEDNEEGRQMDERTLAICRDAGLSDLLAKLPKGLDTGVYKDFDQEGFNPSGGEGQKIAIARAIAKETFHGAPISVLDEPTASLDPIAEYDIYQQFNRLMSGKCAVLITHRLSAVQLADRVAVFDGGQVVEVGTHTQLYEQGGLYTDMFNKQAVFYREGSKTGETADASENDSES